MDFNLKKHREDLVFLPLGGANEIGMNLNLYHLDGKWIMVDCGVGFAYNIPGIDIMTPDISFIKNHSKNLLGLIITHIHEDHLGAVQYLIKELNCPVYTSTLAANFLKLKLAEFKLERQVDIRIIDNSKRLDLNPFNIEFIGLTHSVPEMKALMIRTKKGNILHTGDWKFDPNPVVGEISQKEKIKEYGDNGEILAVVCDSTNALNEGHSRSEGELYQSIKSLIENRKGLVGVTTFASNLARIKTITQIAKDCKRKVVLAGWSLHRICEAARKSGYFFDETDFISDREIKFYDKKDILIISTGCQGEELAATKKIASDKHPFIRFTKGDLMIFSSKIIPGNERNIFALFDLFAKRQIDVMTEKDHFVHVSGHPSQDELREMYALSKPKIAIPVHGEFIHTKAHGEIAKECGVEKILQAQNGLVLKICQENPKANSQSIGFVKSGYLGVDGYQLIDLNNHVISERRKLENSGIATISIVVNESLELLTKPRIICVGSYDLKSDHEAEIFIREEIKAILKIKARELGIDSKIGFRFLKKKKSNKKLKENRIIEDLEKNIRSKILRIFEDIIGKRPAVEVSIHLV